MKEETFPNTRKPFHRWVCGEFWTLRGQHNWEGGENPTDYAPNQNSQQRSSPDTHIHHQWTGPEQRDADCMLRVRARPECPEDNLRELMWDSDINCGRARERKKRETERERIFPRKALRHKLARSPNRGLSEHQKRASQLQTGPSPAGGREAGVWHPEPEGEGQSRHQRRHPPPNCEQAPSC